MLETLSAAAWEATATEERVSDDTEISSSK